MSRSLTLSTASFLRVEAWREKSALSGPSALVIASTGMGFAAFTAVLFFLHWIPASVILMVGLVRMGLNLRAAFVHNGNDFLVVRVEDFEVSVRRGKRDLWGLRGPWAFTRTTFMAQAKDVFPAKDVEESLLRFTDPLSASLAASELEEVFSRLTLPWYGGLKISS